MNIRAERTTARWIQCPRCKSWLTLPPHDEDLVPVGAEFDCDDCGQHLRLVTERTAAEA